MRACVRACSVCVCMCVWFARFCWLVGFLFYFNFLERSNIIFLFAMQISESPPTPTPPVPGFLFPQRSGATAPSRHSTAAIGRVGTASCPRSCPAKSSPSPSCVTARWRSALVCPGETGSGLVSLSAGNRRHSNRAIAEAPCHKPYVRHNAPYNKDPQTYIHTYTGQHQRTNKIFKEEEERGFFSHMTAKPHRKHTTISMNKFITSFDLSTHGLYCFLTRTSG